MASNAPPPKQRSLKEAVLKFIPKELVSENWKCDLTGPDRNLNDLLDKTRPRLEMFESEQDLLDHIETYLDFPKTDGDYPAGWEWIKYNQLTLFPHFHETKENEKWCMYKNDLYKIFDYRTFSSCDLSPKAFSLAEFILESCWVKMRTKSHPEMVSLKNQPTRPTREDLNLRNFVCSTEDDFLTFINRWTEGAERSNNTFRGQILVMIHQMLKSEGGPTYQEAGQILIWVGFVIGKVAQFVRDEDIDMTPLYSTATIHQPKEVFRVFSNDNAEFMLTQDLVAILKKYRAQPDKLVPETFRKQELSTIFFDEAVGILKYSCLHHLVYLEFAKMRSYFLMFARTPIPTFDGGYCILAVDALYELLMDMIMAKKIFYTKPTDKQWTEIRNFIKRMSSFFNSEKSVYFLTLKKVEKIKQEWEKVYATNWTGPIPEPRLIVKPQEPKLFSLEDLTKTLKFLLLDKCFSNIVEYAEPVFATPDEKTPGYMHVAVATCQINCFARKVHKILQFIHKQGFCKRMGIVECDLCDGKMIGELVEKMNKLEAVEKKQEAFEKAKEGNEKKKEDVSNAGKKNKNKTKKNNKK